MKYFVLLLFIVFSLQKIHAQDYQSILKHAQNLEKDLKENEALQKYLELEKKYPNDWLAKTKSAELLISTGNRLSTAKDKYISFYNALVTGQAAWNIDSNNAQSAFILALAYEALSSIESDRKKAANLFINFYHFTQKALTLNANHGKANYLMGNWHVKALNFPFSKKVVYKTMYGVELPKANMDSIIMHYEKCRLLEPYYAANFLALAKAYKVLNNPAKEIEVLKALVKLPNRTADDVRIKEEGKKMLEDNL